MNSTRFTYWRDGDTWIGYVEECPDYWTQGVSLEELKDNLRDVFKDLSAGLIPCARMSGELELV